jgi:hypothetical protein
MYWDIFITPMLKAQALPSPLQVDRSAVKCQVAAIAVVVLIACGRTPLDDEVREANTNLGGVSGITTGGWLSGGTAVIANSMSAAGGTGAGPNAGRWPCNTQMAAEDGPSG